MSALNEITKEKQRVSEALARVDAQRGKLTSQLGELENHYFVPVFRHAFMNAIGPRIAATKWQDIFPSAPTTGYPYPWEDIQLKA